MICEWIALRGSQFPEDIFSAADRRLAHDVRMEFDDDLCDSIKLRRGEQRNFGALDIHHERGRFPFGNDFIERISRDSLRAAFLRMEAGGNDVVTHEKVGFAIARGDRFCTELRLQARSAHNFAGWSQSSLSWLRK